MGLMLLLLRLLLVRSQLVLQRAREVEVMLLLTVGVFPGHRLWVVLLLLLVLRGCETSCMFLDYLGVLDGCVLVQGLLITCLLTTDTTGQCHYIIVCTFSISTIRLNISMLLCVALIKH